MKLFQHMLTACLALGSLQQAAAQCSFTLSDPNPCAGTSVDFSVDNPDPGASYDWDFNGDGQTDASGQAVSYTYPAANADQVFLVSLSENGQSCASQSVTVLAVPDPSIGVPPGIITLNGTTLKACNGSGSITLSLYNASATFAQNTGYQIDWGDGSPAETYTNTNFNPNSTISHTYAGQGYFTLFVSATHQNGCVYTQTYTFYNGGNPSVGIVIPGNTVGLCAPATLDFPITNTDFNPPGTIYTIYINGQTVATYDQDNLPDVFSYTFTESSCNQVTSTGNYTHAFDLKIVASNPCNSSTATIEPIEISAPPIPEILVTAPPGACEGAVFEFSNGSPPTSEVIAGNPSSCIDVLNPTWTILQGLPGSDWNVVSGNLFGANSVQIEFLTPGVYTIQMTLVSFACGEFTFSQDITISEPPPPVTGSATVNANGNANGGCAPVEVALANSDPGAEADVFWTISPASGWSFTDSSTVLFTQGGEYTLTLSSANACSAATWDTVLQILGPPAIALTPLPDACLEATLNLGSAAVQYTDNFSTITQFQWSFPGGQPASSADPFPMGINYFNPGLYPVALTVTNGCGATTLVDTFEIQAPATLDLPADFALCQYESTTSLQATPPNGQWSGPGVNTAGLFNPAIAGPGDHILTYSYGIGACQVDSQMVVTVAPAPVVNAGPNQEICSGEAQVALSPNPQGGIWTLPAGLSLAGNTVNTASLPTGTYQFYYTFTDNVGCQSLDSVRLSVNPSPVAGFSLPPLACAQASVSLENLSTGATAYQWSFGNGATSLQPEPTYTWPDTGLYLVELTVENQFACTDQAVQPLQIISPALPDFEPDLAEGCGPLEVVFINTSEGENLTYAWDFGNGQTSNQASPPNPIIYPTGMQDTTYYIFLQVSNSCGTRTYADTLHVYPMPEAAFGIQVDTGCAPIEVSFNNISTGSPTSFNWIFGNGQSSSDSLPANQWFEADTTPIDYLITLVASNYCGSDTAFQQLTVQAPTAVAFFNASNTQGCAPFTVDFTSYVPAGAMISWDFGDGNIVMADNPSHTFEEPGTYSVVQYVTNPCGGADFASIEIEVLPPPAPSFTFPPIRCAGQEVIFENTSPNLAGSQWDFGDGTGSDLTHPSHSFPAPGSYLVTLTGYAPISGCPATYSATVEIFPTPEAGFNPSDPDGCAPIEVNFLNQSVGADYYLWDFGDGNTSVEAQPGHTYFEEGLFQVSLVATNENGCSDTAYFMPVQAYPTPVADFDLERTAPCGLPAEAELINLSEGAQGYWWDLGDGNSSSQVSLDYVYDQSGVYTIWLYASNQYGCVDSLSRDLAAYPMPEARVEIPGGEGCAPLEMVFGQNSQNTTEYFWDFGDGSSSTDANPTHLFENEGIYSVRLVASYNSVCFDTLDLADYVEVWESPRAGFSWEETPDSRVQFYNESEGAVDFLWSFGDGQSSTEENPLHGYTESGALMVRLDVSNEYGCVDFATEAIVPPLFGRLFVPNAFAPGQGPGETAIFKPKGLGLKEYQLQIFSTYGQLLWESSALQEGQPADGWDGTFNGNLLPQDTYVWKIRAIFQDGLEWTGQADEKGRIRKMGAVVLLR